MKHLPVTASLCLALTIAAGNARADRHTAIVAGIELGQVPSNVVRYAPDKLGGAYLNFSFENRMPRLATPGYRFGFALQPEVSIGILARSNLGRNTGSTFLGVGLRVELQMGVQREKDSHRMAMIAAGYLLGRAAVIGDDRDKIYHFGLGDNFTFGHLRFGFEAGVVHLTEGDENGYGPFLTLFVGYAP